jgi:hypothetical protein
MSHPSRVVAGPFTEESEVRGDRLEGNDPAFISDAAQERAVFPVVSAYIDNTVDLELGEDPKEVSPQRYPFRIRE